MKRKSWDLVCYHFLTLSSTTYASILDGFIDDQDEEIDDGQLQQHLPWRDIPDREEGLREFLDRILEHSRNARQGVTIAGNSVEDALASVVDTQRSPTLSDYPLWRVRCRVCPTVISRITETY